MSVLCKFIVLGCFVVVVASAPAQVTGEKKSEHAADLSSSGEAASLQKKASDVQARIRANEDETNLLRRAVKLNEVGLAREVLLRNGFTAKDLENTKTILRTGGGKGGEDTIEISVTCCDPREITIQRTLEHFTK
jgi:hypothetical protein